MQVICIEKGISEYPGIKIPPLIEGNIYTVISTKDMYSLVHNKTYFCYELSEMIGWYHASELFIPLSEIDETEMNRSYRILEKPNKI